MRISQMVMEPAPSAEHEHTPGGYLTENMVAVLSGLLSAAIPLGVMAAAYAASETRMTSNHPAGSPLGVLGVPLCVTVGGLLAGVLMTARRVAAIPQAVLAEQPDASLLVVPWRHALLVAPGFAVGVGYVALSPGDGWEILFMPTWVTTSYLACLAGYCWRWMKWRPPLFGVLIGGLAYYGLMVLLRLVPLNLPESVLWFFIYMFALWPASIAVPLWWSVHKLRRTGEL
jgi:hypothetical protein